MNRDAKRINPSLRPQIDQLKHRIRHTDNMFDGNGYAFETAIRELRKEGIPIKYDRRAAVYYKDYAAKEPQQLGFQFPEDV